MGRLKNVIKAMFGPKQPEKDPQKQEANKESARVRALNQQIRTLEEINESLTDQVRSYAKQVASNQKINMEERMLEMALNLFAPQTIPKTINQEVIPTPQKNPGTNEDLDLDQIKAFVDELPLEAQRMGAKVPFETFSKVAKSKNPNLKTVAIKQAYDYLIEKMNGV